MTYEPPVSGQLTAEHAHVIMDIVYPQQGLKRKLREAAADRSIAARRRERKGLDEFQVGLEEQNQWRLDKLLAKQAEIDALRAELTPEMLEYCSYCLSQ